MANQLGIIHPGLLSALTPGFYPSLCTIQAATESRDALGQVVFSWSNLAGHVDLACALAEATTAAEETETTQQAYMRRRKRVALAGIYASVTEEHRAVVDGVTYDIERVTVDSHSKTTYLDVELIL